VLDDAAAIMADLRLDDLVPPGEQAEMSALLVGARQLCMAVAASPSELERQAQPLSAEDRARLVEVLLESLRRTSFADIEAAWKRRGDLLAFPAKDVFAEAKRIVR
jgi:hypothetical protein